mmetsp:Transcript_39075/g.116071  ORF Transcript_39075/g.116071 Transcript_39075/m.116071 type:complete len:128 (+) Transcript_39075:79-462(+)
MRDPTSGASARAEGLELHQRPRVVVEKMLNPDRMLDRRLSQAETRGIGWDAGLGGFIAAAITGAYAGAAVVWANYSSPRFRKAFGVSGKLAMVVTPAFFAFLLKSHLVVAYAIADNRKYIAPLSDQR